MLGLFCTDVEPFHTVYLHGMIRAEGGVKMSKTKGNTVDPLGLLEEIGADALRFALISGSTPGSDLRLTQAKLDGGRNFTNKLWNAARFVLANQPEPSAPDGAEPTLAIRWIRSRLAHATERATVQLDALDLGGYASTVYEAAWSDYCDWFLEMAKVDLRRPDASDADRAATWTAAAEGLATLLRLLHPLMPFVTEEIWQALGEVEPRATDGEPLLIRSAWPRQGRTDTEAEAIFANLSALVREVRNLRTTSDTPAGAWVPLVLDPTDSAAATTAEAGRAYIETLAHVRPISLRVDSERPSLVAATPLGAAWLEGEPAADASGAERRAARVVEVEANVERVRGLLANEAFVARAPTEVVERERERLAGLERELAQLRTE
jgi:valyl-tRNA synthetase